MRKGLINTCVGFLVVFSACRQIAVEIPFKYQRNLYLKSVIDGRVPGSIMFDTGAYGLYCDSTFYKQSGLQPLVTSDAYGHLNWHPLHVAVGDHQSTFEEPVIIQTRSSFGKKCDAIMGWDFFGNQIMEIDYEDSLIRLHDPDHFTPDNTFTRIPVTFRN